MANYRNISLNFWTDSKVDDEFTPEDKYFYLYLLTNPHTNICGCYEISSRQMERETGYNADTIKRLLERMEMTHNVIRYCNKTKEVLIINWCKYNWSKSETVKKAVTAVANYIKYKEFKNFVFNKIDTINNKQKTEPETEPDTDTETDTDTVSETDVSIPYAYGIDTISEAEPKQNKTAFVKPTVEEIAAYIKEKGYSIDAEYFYNYYESNGWIVGKTKMKNWKSAVANWQKRNKEYGNNTQDAAQSSYDIDEVEEQVRRKYQNL